MISSNSQHKIHRLVPRRKVKSGSLADISRGETSSAAATTSESISNAKATTIDHDASLTTTSSVGMSTATIAASRERIGMPSSQSPKPPQVEDDSSSSSEEESEPSSYSSERSLLISQIDATKLSPEIDPDTLSNYELLRLRNIQRNEAKLASLGLIGLTTKDQKTKSATNAKPKAKPGNNNNLIIWNIRYQELVAFHSAHGHVTVPTSHGPLYTWAKRQKAQYKSYKEGKKCSLDDERAGMLERLGVEEYWLGNARTVVNKTTIPANHIKKTNTKNPDSGGEEELGSIDSYSEEDEEMNFPPDKSGSSMRRELERLESPKWMDGYSDDDETKSVQGGSASTRTLSDSSRYGLKSSNRKGRRLVNGYSDDETDYHTRRRGNCDKRSKHEDKRMRHRSLRHDSDDYEQNDYEPEEVDTSKTRNKLTGRGGNFQGHQSTKTPVGRISREKHSGNNSTVKVSMSRGRSCPIERGRSSRNRGGQRPMDDYSDDDADSVEEDSRMRRRQSRGRSVKNNERRRLMEENLDDDAYSSEYDDASRTSSSFMRSRRPQKHKGRTSMNNKSQDDSGETTDYETTTRRGGTSKNRRSIEKHSGRSNDHSDDNETRSIDYSTLNRHRGSSKNSGSRLNQKGQRLTEYYYDGRNSSSFEHRSAVGRPRSANNMGKFSGHNSRRRVPTTELQREKRSNVNQQSPRFFDNSTPKQTESRTTPIRLATRHTKTSLEQIEEISTSNHLERTVTHKPLKRKEFVNEGLKRSLSKRRRSDVSEDLDSGTYRSDVPSSSSISSTSASTKSSSLDQTIKPIKEVVITQTLTGQAQRKSLQVERNQILAEYAHLYTRKCLFKEKMTRLMCEAKNLESYLIENKSTLVNASEGSVELMVKNQNVGLSKGSVLVDNFEKFNAYLRTAEASVNGRYRKFLM
ncbi:hypothetical protein HJC23_004085 [Cyclotella cryptica]|uniref:Helicase-associated domain-containing protein n=1 Tax=Cyclotella cryptica TaxID=29204 RepID=A0ABD3P152_9STRA